jgi:hypothetical protein
LFSIDDQKRLILLGLFPTRGRTKSGESADEVAELSRRRRSSVSTGSDWVRSIVLVRSYTEMGQSHGGWREDQQYYDTARAEARGGA